MQKWFCELEALMENLVAAGMDSQVAQFIRP